MQWIDTHCHLDAREFEACGGVAAVRARARESGVVHCVIPAVEPANWARVRELAHAHGDSYALGIHPLYAGICTQTDLDALADALYQWRDDPHLVAVGEIGLDFFDPAVSTPPMRAWQQQVLQAQLRLARALDLPVLLHVRWSVDAVLAALRRAGQGYRWSGIAHAFNGSGQQAQQMLGLGLRLGFGGAMTFERALQLRRLAHSVPPSGWVLETDSPDMPPQWLYRTAQERQSSAIAVPNTPQELVRIAQWWAQWRGITVEEVAATLRTNACAALPRLQALLPP